MARYETYRDSGVEWIGFLPKSWAVNKLGNLGRYINGYAFKPNQWGDHGLPIIRIQDLTGSNDSPNFFDGEIDTKYLVNPGDLLVSWAATIGVYCWIRQPGWLNQHIFRVIPNEEICCKQFFYWMLNAAIDALNNENKHGIMMEHLTLSVFNAFRVPQPPISDQQAIADYLDARTAEIDALVEDCEREVELLREYRKAVISEAVTKGLDPDAPMKDSGVEWIGEIPENWETKRIKEFCKLQTGHTPTTEHPEYFDGDVEWYTPGDINNDVVESSNRKVSELAVRDNQVPQYAPNAVLLVAIGGTAGKVGFVPWISSSNQQITAIMAKTNEPKWLFYSLLNMQEHLFNLAMFTTLPILNNDYLANFILAVPSSDEQSRLCEYLDNKTAEIDSLIEAKRAMADKLREYRKSLISEAVTGKFKVPEVK